jgi:hypothetical protein
MADKQYSISVVLKAVDKMTKPLTAMSTRLTAISTRMKTMSAGINRFTNRAFLMTGLATGALTAFIMKTASAGDTLAKTATMLDISAAKLHAYRFAARRSGLSTQELDRSMMFFTRNIGDAVQGTGEAKRAFEALGIQLRNNDGRVRTNIDLFEEVTDKIAVMADQNLRLSALQLMFGRSGARLFNMMKDGSKGLAEYEKRLKAIGGDLEGVEMKRFEDFKDMVEDIETSVGGLSFILVSELAPSITRFLDKIALKIGGNRKTIVKAIGDIIDKFKAFLGGIWEGVQGVIKFADALLGALIPSRRSIDKATDSTEKFRNAGKALVGILASLKALQVATMFMGIAIAVTSLTAALLANPLLTGILLVSFGLIGKSVIELIGDINKLGFTWEYIFLKMEIAVEKLIDRFRKLAFNINKYSPERWLLRKMGILPSIGFTGWKAPGEYVSEAFVPHMGREREKELLNAMMRRETERSMQQMRANRGVLRVELDKGLKARETAVGWLELEFGAPDMGLLGAGG